MHLADLEDIDPADLTCGGKAAGLARLIALQDRRFAVPPGFAVAATVLEPDRWPDGLRRAFEARCSALLAGGAVAVRSSAVAEDGAERSFAGLFETALGVTDLAGAWAAASRCIASGGAGRVLDYSGRNEPLPVGLVVQRQVDARTAGVVFTVDPAGRDPGLVLEAVAGTGEGLVSGRRPPERWRAYRAGTGGIEVQAADPATAGVLAPCDVSGLAALAWELAARWGTELDLEWAIDGNGLVQWLQARPITARTVWRPPVVTRSVPDADDGPVTVWANWNVRETLPDPMAPLTWSIWSESIMPALTRDVLGMPEASRAIAQAIPLDLVNGRVYFNMNAMLASPVMQRGQLARLLSFIDSRAARTTGELLALGVLRPRRLPASPLELALSALRAAGDSLRRLGRVLRPAESLARLEMSATATIAGPPVTQLADADLPDVLGLFARREAEPLREGVAMAQAAFFLWLAADRLFASWPAARRLLAAGVPDNPTTAISVAIDDLADAGLAAGLPGERSLGELRAAGDPAAAAWLARFDEFLARFGQRGPREFDLAEPRWADAPDQVLALVRTRQGRGPGEHVRERLQALRDERVREVAKAIAAAPAWRRLPMRLFAAAVPRFMPLREAPKHHAMRVFQRVRAAALEAGRRLAARGIVDAPPDVFFLEKAEIVPLLRGDPIGADSRALVARRRAEHAAFRLSAAPAFVRSDGVPVPEDAVSGDGETLCGVGIGTGSGQGPVAILADPDPDRLPAGAVLVVKFADPGWTPLFPRAAAIVMEVGGAMCHAAVIARELGIPAVFGVPGATSLLRDGQVVVVDGDAGTVRGA